MAKQKLVKKDEKVQKQSHFFKTTSRLEYTSVFATKTGACDITPGQYHPDAWQLKPGQIWIDTITK